MLCFVLSLIMIFFAYGKGYLSCLIVATIVSMLGFCEPSGWRYMLTQHTNVRYDENQLLEKAEKLFMVGDGLLCVAALVRWGIVAFS